MPNRTDRDWLLDILEEGDLLVVAIAGKTLADFHAEPVLQRAVLHMLQTIGEAAGQLSPQTLAAIHSVPWQQIRGLRNRIVHGYFGIDLGAVWLTATADVPDVTAKVRASGLV